jgi:hypothetical protein
MKKQALAVLLATAALLGQGQAQSFNPVANGSFSAGDILIGFSSDSANKNYVLDIGTDISVFTAINVGADLTTVFGNNWASAVPDLKWGVFGINYNQYGDPSTTIASVATGGTPPVKLNSGLLITGDSAYNTVINQLNNDGVYGGGLTYGTKQVNGVNLASKSVGNMWLGTADSATPFSIFNVAITASAEDPAINLDVYTTTALTSVKSTTLSLASDGTVSAVPEPSTYALIGLGALVFFVAYRRKANA